VGGALGSGLMAGLGRDGFWGGGGHSEESGGGGGKGSGEAGFPGSGRSVSVGGRECGGALWEWHLVLGPGRTEDWASLREGGLGTETGRKG